MFSSIASGSFKTDGMVIVPCSMGTLSKISSGTSDNLLTRAADVMIKEKRKLILIPRETPLSSIHLKNMLFLSNLNVMIIPPMPAFYEKPKTIEDIVNITVGRILASLNVDSDLYHEWGGTQMIKINNLNVCYKNMDKYTKVIENANLTVKKGEICAIIGPSGGGKSTLLKVLAGIIVD